MVVEVGLVLGTRPATTPTGTAASRILFSRSSPMMPMLRTSRMDSYTVRPANRFLVTLSPSTPKPVSSTAMWASSRACRHAASLMARTISSTCR